MILELTMCGGYNQCDYIVQKEYSRNAYWAAMEDRMVMNVEIKHKPQ